MLYQLSYNHHRRKAVRGDFHHNLSVEPPSVNGDHGKPGDPTASCCSMARGNASAEDVA